MERDEATLYIRQQCLISFEDALKMQPETRLEKIFSTLDLYPIISRLPRKHNGPRGYNAKYKLRALIAAKIEQIPTMAALVRRLKNDPVFRYICGFGVIASVPSEATMSRFLRELTETGILKELFKSLVNKAEQMGIIDCTSIAIDSTKIEAYEKTKPRKYVSQNGKSADWGVKRNTDGNTEAWFGYKVHAAVDTKSELPIAITVTPANVHDSEIALKLVKKASSVLVKSPKFYLMDSAYDCNDIYETIKNDFHAQAIIALNLRGTRQPRAGFDYDGTPVCSAGFRMVYWGSDNGVNKFRCPHVLNKAECPFGTDWCSSSNYGMVIKTKIEDDSRLFCSPHRGTKNWQKLYDERTSVERYFGRQKKHLGLESITVQGTKKVETHAYLCAIALIATVTAVNTAEREQKAA